MIKLLADENFNNHIIRGVLRQGRGRTDNRLSTLPFGTVLATFIAPGYWVVGPLS